MVALAGAAGKRATPVRRRLVGWPNSLLRCDLCEAGACDCRLTVGDAAVVDGYGVRNQDSETHAFELAGEELEQKSVHEHATRERDGIDAFARTDFACDSCRRARDGDMEVEREPAGGYAGPDSRL